MKFYSDDRVDLYGGDSLAVLASLPTMPEMHIGFRPEESP